MMLTPGRTRLIGIFAGTLACLFAADGLAQKTWTGQSSNQWTNSSNWNPSGVPGSSDDVIIDLVNPNSPVINGGTQNIFNLTVGRDSTANLTVINGAQFGTRGITLGRNATGSGLLTLTGAGTTMSPFGELALPIIHVGFNGTGFLDVRDGAAISGNYDIEIGSTNTGTGELLLTGSGSTIDIRPVTGRRVWVEDRGRLILADGGQLFTNGTVLFRGTDNAPRQLVFGALEGSPAVPAGTLHAAKIEVNASAINDSTIVFNHTGSMTLDLDIEGPGRIRQISGNTTYTGTAADLQSVYIGGFLQIGDGGTAGLIAGHVDNQGTLTFNRSDDLTYAGAISGNGTVTKLGAGTLTFTGSNSYTLGTQIFQGTLQVGNGGSSGRISGPVNNSGILAFNRSNNWTYAGNILGSGSLHHLGSGQLTMTGSHTYSGETRINQGTLRLNGGSISHPGANLFVAISDGDQANLRLESNSELASNFGVIGPVPGSFGEVLVNDSIWSMNSNLAVGNQGAGVLVIENGGEVHCGLGVIANSSNSDSKVIVRGSGSNWNTSGGIVVGGNGSGVGRLEVLDGATALANPGAAVGPVPASGSNDRIHVGPGSTFQVIGPYTQGSASTYEIGLLPNQAGLIAVTGEATIQAGATIVPLPAAGEYPLGATFTILTASAGVTGSFTLDSPLGFDLVHNANNVQLVVTGEVGDSIFKDRFED